MAEEDLQERNEEASPKRLQDARDRGQVPRSRELNTLGILFAGGASLVFLGPAMLDRVADVMRTSFRLDPLHLKQTDSMMEMFVTGVHGAVIALMPFLLVMLVTAALIPLALGGWTASTKAMSFQWERIDPIKGIKRVFSIKGLVELLKALVKFSFMGAIGGAWLWHSAPDYLLLGLSPLGSGMDRGAEFVLMAFLISIAPMLVIAAIDVPFQLWDFAKEMRMSRREVKDESKDTDGNPELKARIRRQQQELSQRRMMEAVPDADVIISNPTHFSVALRYDRDNPGAPIVVARGTDLVALKIREIGAAHSIPQVRSPLLARALYFNSKLDREIPLDLYVAVAQVLAYVYRLRESGLSMGRPVDLADIDVPDGMRTD